MTDARGPVHLSGELSLEVDGVGVQVHADGTDLRIVTEDVGAFVARARQAATARSGVAPGRRDLGGLAGQPPHCSARDRPCLAPPRLPA